MQTTLIDALRRPDAYPEGVDDVQLVETHISWVLLAGDTVYKLKKPLDLGFLDFSTLARRKFYCEEEIRLNRRTAPDLYLDVVPVCGTAEQPAFNGAGEVIDYAVRMRRFDADAGFDRLLQGKCLAREHVVGLARALAELHASAAVAAPESIYGTVNAAAVPIQDNFTDLARALGRESIAACLAPLQEWTQAEVTRLGPRIEERHRRGFIRECHGDAHLGNVALVNGRATLFDCVEFSSDLRWIDTMSDLAFPLMDLLHRGATGFAWRLLDDYLAATGDYAGVRLLPLYLVHRALVRAKVTALRLDDTDVDRDALITAVAGYLALASRICRESRPAILITVGLSGSGKSWLVNQLVERVGLVRVRSDVERKRIHGLSPRDRCDTGLDADLYSPAATERTYRCLADAAQCLADAGLPIVIDAACLKHSQRDRFRDLAAQHGVPFGILHCHANDAVLRRRLLARQASGSDPSDAGLAVLEHQQQTLEPLTPGESAATLRVDTAGGGVDNAAAWVGRLAALNGIGHIPTAG